MTYFLQKAVFPILRITTTRNSPPILNKMTNKLSNILFCKLLRQDPRIVGALRAAVWISAQTNSSNFTAYRSDDASKETDEIIRGDGETIPVNHYPILKQLSYSSLEAIQASSNTKTFFGGVAFESIYNQILNLAGTPEQMYAFVLANAKAGYLFMHEDIHSPNLGHKIILKSREKEIPVNAVVKIFSTGVCGTDIRGVHGKRREIGPMTTLGHEIFGVIAETKGIKNPKITVGSMVNLIPHFWCGVCLPCMTGHTNYCEFRKHIGFEHTSGGGFAQYIAVPEQNIVPYPEGLTFSGSRRHFAILEPMICCLHARELMKEKPGDRNENPYKDKNVVIFGAGPIGCIHARIAKLDGAKSVTLIDLTEIPDEKKERIEEINRKAENGVYDNFITYECDKFSKKKFFEKIVSKALTDLKAKIGGENIEIIILAASSRVAYELAVKLIGNSGKILFFSGLPKEERLPLKIGEKTIDIHDVHHRDQIIDIKEGTRSFRIVGAQGFYPKYNGMLWNDFSEENVRYLATLNPSLFVTNEIRLEEDDGENEKKLLVNLRRYYMNHLKSLVIIGHKLNR